MKTRKRTLHKGRNARSPLLGVLTFPLAVFAATTVGFGQEQCVAPPAGLVSWWPGDGDATDIGNGNDGTPVNGTAFGPGFVSSGTGEAFTFDGVDDHVSLPPITFGPALTVEAWIYPTITGAHTVLGVCVDPNSNCTGLDYKAVFLRLQGSDQLAGGFSDGVWATRHIFATTNGAVTLNAWTHVAMTVDTALNTINLYINGVAQPATLSIVGAGAGSFTAAAHLGSMHVTFGDVPKVLFTGLVDEVMLFDRALSPAEIQAHADAGSAGTCKCLPSEELCDGIDNDCDGLTDEGFIDILAATHLVGSGSHPGSTKESLVGIEVCAYDKADGSCSRVSCGGISHQHYQCIVDSCTPTDCCTTDEFGECTIEASPGDYIVISDDASKTVLPDPLGVSASDLLCGEVKRKHLQQIVKANGKKVSGKTTRRTGSELLIIEPEYVIWDGTVQEYPFVFEAVGDWGVTTSVAPPEGFVSDYDSLSADVYNEIEAVQFTITEVGSDLVPTGTTFDVTHKGRREIIHSKVDIFLTAEYARERGFNVKALRAEGLIKELPAQSEFGQSHRESGDE